MKFPVRLTSPTSVCKLGRFTIFYPEFFFNCEWLVWLLPFAHYSNTDLNNFHTKSLPGKANIESIWRKDFVEIELLVLSTSLNHWLPGSHMLSLPKHLQVLTTMVFSESTSRQAVEPLLTFVERCILESEMVSHFAVLSVQIIPSCAGFSNSFACKQKYVPFNVKVFWAE